MLIEAFISTHKSLMEARNFTPLDIGFVSFTVFFCCLPTCYFNFISFISIFIHKKKKKKKLKCV